MAEAAAGEVIVLHLDDELRRERLPFRRALCAPSAGPARRLSGKPRLPDELLQLGGELRALFRREARGEPDVMQQAFVIVQAQQHRADNSRFLGVTKASDHAVGGPLVLHLDHSGALA